MKKTFTKFFLAAGFILAGTTSASAQTFTVGTDDGKTSGNANYWHFIKTGTTANEDGIAGNGFDNPSSYSSYYTLSTAQSTLNHNNTTYTIISTATSENNANYKAALQRITFSKTVPSYTKIVYNYKFVAYTNNSDGGSIIKTPISAVEVLNWDATDQTTSSSITYSTKSSPAKSCNNSIILCNTSGKNSNTAESNSITWTLDNSTATADNNFNRYMAVFTWKRTTTTGANSKCVHTGKFGYYLVSEVPSYYNQIQYNTDGGSTISATDFATSNTVTSTVPTKTGYTFAGWKDANGNTVAAGTTYTATATAKGPIALTAVWTPINYAITYNLNGGTNATANPATYTIETETFSLADPSKDKYNFTGWTFDGQTEPTKSVTIAKGSTGAKTYTANWTLASVTANMTITAAGWATFCAPFEITELPEGVKAYKGEIADNSWVKLTEQELPIEAGTPLVLAGPTCTKDYTAVPTVTECVSGTCLTGNLTGALADVEEDANNYLLQKQSGVVGWYLVAGADRTIAANRCYMTKSSTPGAPDARAFYGMSFDEATAISSINATAAKMTDGKYLVNGKIVIVKAGKAYNMNGQNIK